MSTADERILDEYTGFITDIGMTGAYDSVIGMRKDLSIAAFRAGKRKRFIPAKNGLSLNALIVDIDKDSGACINIKRIRWDLDD